MSTRSTIIMAVVLALLFPLWWHSDKVKAPTDEELKTPQIFEFPADDVGQLEITTTAGKVTLKKENGVWRVVAPFQGLAALSDITSLASQMGTLKADRVVAEDVAPGLLKQYGLDKPKLKITATLAGEKPPVTVMLGGRTPGETGWYVATPDNDDVYVGGNTLTFVVSKKPEDWRERAVLSFEPEKIDRVVIEEGKKTLQLEQAKDGSAWSIVMPKKQKAELEEVRKFINAIKGIRIESFIDKPQVGDPGGAKGDRSPVVKPVMTLKMWNKGDRDPQILIVGGPVKGGVIATRGSDKEREVFVLGNNALTALKVDPSTLAERRMFDFAVDGVAGATISHAGVGEAKAEKKGGNWGYLAPASKPDDLGRINSLAYAISQLKFTRKVSAPAEVKTASATFAKPVAHFVLTGDKGARIADLEVGGATPDRVFHYVRKDGGKDIYVADTKFADEWKATIAALKGKPLPSPSAAASPAAPDPHGH